MTGIREYFAELSSPDYYDVSAQLELWGWHKRKAARERDERRQWKPARKRNLRMYQRRWLERLKAALLWNEFAEIWQRIGTAMLTYDRKAAYRWRNREKAKAYHRTRRTEARSA